MNVSWFSAGVSSAVATKLVIAELDKIIYIHIDDQHPDTMRFVKDCEAWFGKPIEILQSKYKTVEAALRANGGEFWSNGGTVNTSNGVTCFINTPGGAPCTRTLKKRVRKEWMSQHKDEKFCFVWGMDMNEKHRCDGIIDAMPENEHRFPLIEKGWSKEYVHQVMAASGIKRPAMYDLGYHNNNCVGCVKGGMGYWNKIRVDFPDVFNSRAKMERAFDHSCINGVFLDELEPKAGLHEGPIVGDCGILCEVMGL